MDLINLSKECVNDLMEKAKDWALVNGLTMRSKTESGSEKRSIFNRLFINKREMEELVKFNNVSISLHDS